MSARTNQSFGTIVCLQRFNGCTDFLIRMEIITKYDYQMTHFCNSDKKADFVCDAFETRSSMSNIRESFSNGIIDEDVYDYKLHYKFLDETNRFVTQMGKTDIRKAVNNIEKILLMFGMYCQK